MIESVAAPVTTEAAPTEEQTSEDAPAPSDEEKPAEETAQSDD